MSCGKIQHFLTSVKCKTQFFRDKNAVFLLFKKVITFLACFAFVLTSGYSGLEFSFSNKAVGLTYVLLLFLSLLVFGMTLPKMKKTDARTFFKKMLTPKNVLIISIFAAVFISMAATIMKCNNLNGSLRFIVVILSSLFIVASVGFGSFASCFCYTVLLICLSALPIFLIGDVLGASGATDFFFTNNNAVIYAYGPFAFFVNKWNTYLSGAWATNRLAGPFWEPSIFAAVLILALLLLYFAPIRKKRIFATVYVVSLLLTFSTGGYIVAVLVGLFFLTKKIKSRANQDLFSIISLTVFLALFFIVFGPLLPHLVKMFPTVFGKFYNGLDNVRFYSIQILFRVFSKSPLFGYGINGARMQYISYFPESATDFSITSTTGMICASFGVPGLLFSLLLFVGPFFNKKNSFGSNLLICVILLILINLENMMLMSCVILTLFFFAKEGLYGEKCLASSPNNQNGLLLSLMENSEEGKTGKGMFGLLLVKGLSMVLGLFAIPVYNSFFGTNDLYGTWSVVISVLTWTLLLDFGFGSGLRARLTDVPRGDHTTRKRLISSTYIGSAVISLATFVCFEVAILVLDLNQAMGIDQSIVSSAGLKASMSILLLGLCTELVLKNITFIYYAENKNVRGSSYGLITNFLVIVLFFVFKDVNFSDRMIAASSFYALSVVAPLIVGTLSYFLKKEGKKDAPSFKSFNLDTCKSVMSFGLLFFLTQIGFLLIARTDSIFISNLYGPSDAGDYSKYYKIFSFFIGLMGSVVQQPVWSAVAAAANQKNVVKIQKMTKVTLGISLVLFVFCLLFGCVLQIVFDLWLGENSIPVTSWATISFLVFSLILLVSDALIIIANGLKIIKAQAIIVLISGVMKIGIFTAMHFVRGLYDLGWPFLILVDALCYLPLVCSLPFLIKSKEKKLLTDEKGELNS